MRDPVEQRGCLDAELSCLSMFGSHFHLYTMSFPHLTSTYCQQRGFLRCVQSVSLICKNNLLVVVQILTKHFHKIIPRKCHTSIHTKGSTFGLFFNTFSPVAELFLIISWKYFWLDLRWLFLDCNSRNKFSRYKNQATCQ